MLRLALAQINCTVGDLKGNSDAIIRMIKKAEADGADVVVFPELALDGYPPEDLLLKPHFVEDNLQAIEKVAKHVNDIMAVVGFTAPSARKGIANAAAVIHKRRIIDVYHKIHLPNYGVFDEFRYFSPGTVTPVYVLGRYRIGVSICQDIWEPRGPACRQVCFGGAQLILVLNASPYHRGKGKERADMLKRRAMETRSFLAYCNMVGGQDELVFDGQGMIFGPRGELISRGDQFQEQLLVTDVDTAALDEARSPYSNWVCRDKVDRSSKDSVKVINVGKSRQPTRTGRTPAVIEKELAPEAEVYEALKTGVKDYVRKNGFKQAVVGLSGGIDSALTLVIAADALGNRNVEAVFMPSAYTSDRSRKDAEAVANNLNVNFRSIPIDETFDSYKDALKSSFKRLKQDTAEENLQARIRGNLLMALANKFGWLVLATGNKSELAVGYSTLYGDMAGGFEVIKDVPKTYVYKLAQYRNSVSNVIPDSVIRKAPSAELKPGQKDTDSLPPYEVLDPIVQAYVEDDKSPETIAKAGFDKKVVLKVIDMIDRNEYKRRQAPPGIKITPKAFGKDRRLPITNWYRK